RTHCSQLITTHWNDFTCDDFQYLSAPMAFNLFKQKTKYPLHQAVRMKREDVLFLYLIDNDSELTERVNELDDHEELPLELALRMKQDSMAENLVRHKADINFKDKENRTLLHMAIKRGDEHTATFLVRHQCLLDHETSVTKETPLHLLSSLNHNEMLQDIMDGMCRVTKLILESGGNPNKQDSNGNNCLHRCVLADNIEIFKEILKATHLMLDERNKEGHVPLWLALQQAEQLHLDFKTETFSSLLVQRGCSVDAIDSKSSNTLLHKCAKFNYQNSGLFLIENGAQINYVNQYNEIPLHFSSEIGLETLTNALLKHGGNSNAQTHPSSSVTIPTTNEEEDNHFTYVGKQTPMHRAVYVNQEKILQLYIKYKEDIQQESQEHSSTLIIPDFNIQDENGQSVFSLTLWTNMLNVSKQLLNLGANINIKDSENVPLLHQAIIKQSVLASLFLLEQGVDANEKLNNSETPLQLAVKHHLPSVVEALCRNGVNMNVLDENHNSVLWNALDSGQEDIATILVKYGCDSTGWSNGPENCRQTLLHRAIDENNEPVACFLIKSGCDINTARQPGVNGETPDEAKDLQTPLHLACTWGLEKVCQTLIDHHADINKKDAEGNTPLHVAIINQHVAIIKLLIKAPNLDLSIRNKQSHTPFACAMSYKNNEAANAILKREPRAAEQLLAGANIDDVTANRRSSLHIAAEHGRASICSILIESHIQCNLLDANQNNALHMAVQHAHLDVVRTLLTESDVDVLAVNANGHLCRALVTAGANLSIYNNDGISIFTQAVASKALLVNILDTLQREPPWGDSDNCLECGMKFTITNRKHHCRHCGRVLCKRCSVCELPIMKFNLQKPVRVCQICNDVLTLGVMAAR
ncbi:unnamed protein product, partial [Didymodactylos carnosus]